jgi:hypothetical protein
MALNSILTKENFWNEMEQKYPKAMAHFKEWIDKYKVINNWEDLFNDGWEIDSYGGTNKTVAPKYHELPIAMQFGIFIEYSLYCIVRLPYSDTTYRGFSLGGNNLKSEFRQLVDQVFTIVTFDILKLAKP